MRRLAFGIAYNGADWQGWQTQPSRRTVQDVLEAAMAQFAACEVHTVCAGRTDAGVHALEQVVHADVTVQRRLESWVKGVNAFLPPSIAVQWAREVPAAFHARYAARSRTYVYLLRNCAIRSPLLHGRVGWTHHLLDPDRMRRAARVLCGRHDFTSFRSSECQARDPVRTLHEIEIEHNPPFFLFRFRADGFLHHMVRNLMGALIGAGRGALGEDTMAQLLSARDRTLAPATWPPEGLYLARVDYAPEFELPATPVRQALTSHLGFSWP